MNQKSKLNPAKDLKRRIILSASSDIGTALAQSWLEQGFEVLGTFRTYSINCDKLEHAGAKLIHCDLNDKISLDSAIKELSSFGQWDVLTIAVGTVEPIGEFLETDFDHWENSISINFISQLRFIHGLLPYRRQGSKLMPLVLFFAGGGTNNATINYSAYTISKIASIKICELLDAEIPDTRFVILGPGVVRTKIHEATLNSPEKAGSNYKKTLEILSGDKCYPMSKVVDCCNWLITGDRNIISGRNFSAVNDKWGYRELENLLASDQNIYKLRRFGNDLLH